MAEAEKKTAKKDTKKSNVGVIIAIIIAVVAVAGVIAAIFLLSGEKNSEENEGGAGKTSSPIVGIWKYKDMDAKYVFNDDGTCSYDYYNSSQKCTYTDNGDSVEILYDGNTSSTTSNYRIEDGKTLYIEDVFGDEVEYEKQ